MKEKKPWLEEPCFKHLPKKVKKISWCNFCLDNTKFEFVMGENGNWFWMCWNCGFEESRIFTYKERWEIHQHIKKERKKRNLIPLHAKARSIPA